LEPEHAVACVLHRERARELAQELKPDLIVLDSELVRHGGEPIESALADWKTLCAAPLLVLAPSDGSPDDAFAMLENGAQDLVSKPFLSLELRARVRNLVAAKRTHDLLEEAAGKRQTDVVRLAGVVARHQRHLERAIGELQHARRAAEEANQIKRNFLRIMSHELKTPVTAMQLHLRMLERDPQIRELPQAGEGFARIQRSSRRLLCLIDTVLEWARVESGRVELVVEPFDVEELVRDVIEELQPHAAQKQTRIALMLPDEPLPDVAGDRRLVRLSLVNLVLRAVQVTHEGKVEVRVSAGPAGGEACVRVRDAGTRIGRDEEHELFDPLSSRSLHDRSGSGSGLGLHVVRDLAHAYDGEIVLERDALPTHGNSFLLRIPSQPKTQSSLRLSSASTGQAEGRQAAVRR
jgi:signal transduction histidine kinase